ncbi:unnamed protein product [Cylicocyclus nassatus]|uniref:Uncharacterized protein n=1 Tax=Cylicocyclus nassatus TaxID=53992 RepID=A0AA36GMY6_CYLNA|nr:unnamed protein product [Cylicocyclus nassatus]
MPHEKKRMPECEEWTFLETRYYWCEKEKYFDFFRDKCLEKCQGSTTAPSTVASTTESTGTTPITSTVTATTDESECEKECPGITILLHQYFQIDRYNTAEIQKRGMPLPRMTTVTTPTSTMATSSSDASAASEATSSSKATSTTTEANVIDEEPLELCKKMNDSSTKYACKRDGKHFSKVSECESHCRDRPELCRLEHIDNEDKLICVRNRSISYDVWDQRKCEEECSGPDAGLCFCNQTIAGVFLLCRYLVLGKGFTGSTITKDPNACNYLCIRDPKDERGEKFRNYICVHNNSITGTNVRECETRCNRTRKGGEVTSMATSTPTATTPTGATSTAKSMETTSTASTTTSSSTSSTAESTASRTSSSGATTTDTSITATTDSSICRTKTEKYPAVDYEYYTCGNDSDIFYNFNVCTEACKAYTTPEQALTSTESPPRTASPTIASSEKATTPIPTESTVASESSSPTTTATTSTASTSTIAEGTSATQTTSEKEATTADIFSLPTIDWQFPTDSPDVTDPCKDLNEFEPCVSNPPSTRPPKLKDDEQQELVTLIPWGKGSKWSYPDDGDQRKVWPIPPKKKGESIKEPNSVYEEEEKVVSPQGKGWIDPHREGQPKGIVPPPITKVYDSEGKVIKA